MSWGDYINRLTAPDSNGIKVVEEAAIVGIDGSVWATSPGFSVTADEVKRLVGNRSDFGACGTTISGTKCRMLRDNLDDNDLHCLDMRTAADAAGNTFSMCVNKTKKAFVIARGCKDASGGQVAKHVASTADYLIQTNF